MAQCIGQSKRTGRRCGRTAVTGQETCFYHSAAARRNTRAAAPRTAATGSRSTPATEFTTKELSPSTWDDFETVFAPGTGWGRCACLAAFGLPRPGKHVARTWAEMRTVNLGTHHDLVGQGRARGILVYDDGEPIGWCQFGLSAELMRGDWRPDSPDEAADRAAWRVTCFVAAPGHRGRGVPRVALHAAIEAIRSSGGGIVEGYPCAVAPEPPPKGRKGAAYREGDIGFYDGAGWVRYGVEVGGVGPVWAKYRRGATMFGGTVDVFQQEGFKAVSVLPRPTAPRAAIMTPDRIVMRRTV